VVEIFKSYHLLASARSSRASAQSWQLTLRRTRRTVSAGRTIRVPAGRQVAGATGSRPHLSLP